MQGRIRIAFQCAIVGVLVSSQSGCHDQSDGFCSLLDCADGDNGAEPPNGDGRTDCNWAPLGLSQPVGYVAEIAFDPRVEGTVYAASGPQVYAARTNCEGFQRIATLDTNINSLTFPPGQNGELLAGTTSGIYESLDDGRTWTEKSLGGLNIKAVMVHPADPRLVLVAVDSVGLLRSLDGGENWVSANEGVPDGVFNGLLGDPRDAGRILTAVESYSSGGAMMTTVIESVDAGATWHTLLPFAIGQARGLVACGSDFETLIAGAGANLVRSLDSGRSWSPLSLGRAPITTTFAVDGADCNSIYVGDLLSANQATLIRSTNGGANFSGPHLNGTEWLHSSYARKLVVDPSNAQHLFMTMSAGLFESQDGADSWQLVSGVGVPQVNRMIAVPEHGEVLATTWGAGLWRWTRESNRWGAVATPQDMPDTLTSIAMSPRDSGDLLIGAWTGVFQSKDGGKTFKTTSTTETPHAFAYSTDQESTVFAATDGSGVVRSDHKGDSPWAPYSEGLTPFSSEVPFYANGYFMRALAFDSKGNAYLGGERRGVFFRAASGGRWEALSDALNAVSVRCLLGTADGMYACTDTRGVARIDLDSRSVTFLSAGLSSLTVSGLAYDGSLLYATTGTGVYRLSVADGRWSSIEPECLPGRRATSVPAIYRDGNAAKLIVRVDDYGIYARDL